MKTKIFNYDKLALEEMHDKIVRVKAIILNQKKEILIAEDFDTPQFPGGHVNDKECLRNALKREILEETGITLKDVPEPFYCIKYLLKDFPNKGHNRVLEIYYFKIITNEKFNLDNIKLDKQESVGNFKLTYIPLEYLKKYLKINNKRNKINKIISREMNLAIKHMK